MANGLGWLVAVLVSITAALLWIPRELWRRRRKLLADYLDVAVSRRMTRFHRRYREHLMASLRFIDQKGLATVGFYTPDLDDVFVDVSLDYRAPHQVPASVLADISEAGERHSIGDFLDRERPMVLAVLGAPGSGKTTLLRHTGRQLCQGSKGRRRTVPVLIYLRDHIAEIVAEPTVPLATVLRGTLGELRHSEPSGWFEQRLADGDCLVLLDGLDEVAKQEDRRTVADWVERQTQLFPKNDFVITSRPQGYQTAPVAGAVVLQARGFTDDQVTAFVRGWYRAFERLSTGSATPDVELRANADADDLLTRLHNAPALSDLTVNPLLLTMIANVHRYRGALPGSRVDLYGEICQVMLWRRQEAKRLTSELSGERTENLLRGLAFTMMRRQMRDIPRSQVIAELRPALRRISTTMTCEDFLDNVSSNGLLVEREAGYYSFAHLTFQEYLAAMHIRDTGSVDVLAAAVHDVWWRETTLLYTARAVADPIVEACLASGSVTALALAFEIADSGDLAPELRNRLNDILRWSNGDPAQRRMRTGIRVTQFLRHSLIRTATGRVCRRPISGQIYQLFLSDSRETPTGAWSVATGPDEPVLGVWARDATAFVRWVNEVTDGEPGYRLPTRTEIEDPAVRHAFAKAPELRVWLHSPSGSPELWLPNADQPNRISGEVLIGHVRDDVARLIPTLLYLTLLHGEAGMRAGASNDQLDLVLEFASDLVRDLDRSLAGVRLADRAMSRVVDRGKIRDVVRASDLVRTVDAVRDNVRDLARALDLSSRHRALIRASDLARSLLFTLSPDRTVAHALGLTGDTVADRDGVSVVATPLRHAISRGDEIDDRGSGRFARMFVDWAGLAGRAYDTTLDSLDSKIQVASGYLRSAPRAEARMWTHQVATRLIEMALPIVNRQAFIIADTASAIRTVALCLAGLAGFGSLYREIAAGITLLERRASGAVPATEAIVLATG